MRARAIEGLCQLADPDFFDEVGRGLELVLANAQRLVDDAQVLFDNGKFRSAAILLGLAEEEAAKYLVLLDAVRSERHSPTFARQVRRFNDHIAKGIYAQYAGIRPATFGEAIEYIQHFRQEYYLDGPNDIDWIFRNRIAQDREVNMYVDFTENEGEYEWASPLYQWAPDRHFMAPEAFRLARALHDAGFANPEALETVARRWRPLTFEASSEWHELRELNVATLQDLEDAGLLATAEEKVYRKIADEWLFPLYGTELTQVNVSREQLRAERTRWAPNY